MLIIESAGVATESYFDDLVRDPVLLGADGGVRFLFDLAFPWCYPGGNPDNGAVVKDVSEHANGSAVISSAADSIAYAGGGFDFSAMTLDGNCVTAPAAVCADIHGSGQEFAVVVYVKLPTEADWTEGGAILPFFTTTSGASGYATPEPDMVTIAQAYSAGTRRLTARRQTDGGTTIDALNISVAAGAFGQVAQIAFWRDASGQTLRLRTASTDQSATAAVGIDNTGNFSTKIPQFGVPGSFWGTTADNLDASNYRLYRGWVENLATSERDMVAALNADWERVVARSVFS